MSAALSSGVGLRPVWLRPLALSLILTAHAALLFAAKADLEPPPSLDSMEVSLVPLGNSTVDQKPQDEIKPQEEAKPPENVKPSPAVTLTAPPPQQVAPEAPPLPIAKVKPILKPKPKPAVEEDDDEPSPAQLREIARRKHEAMERRRQAQEARQEARRGQAGGSEQGGMSRANYAGLVVAELNRHKFFPAAARAAGVTGSVGVAFSIGSSGRVVSQSVTRSSGNGSLDSAARAMMSAIQAPSPPGGHFSTSTTIRFNLN